MFGMQFLTPLFLAAGAAAAAVPLVIHLLNRERARRLVFSTLRFIKMSHQVNIQRHRLKQLILLLMRILILALLGLAFARPFVRPCSAKRGSATRCSGFRRAASRGRFCVRSPARCCWFACLFLCSCRGQGRLVEPVASVVSFVRLCCLFCLFCLFGHLLALVGM